MRGLFGPNRKTPVQVLVHLFIGRHRRREHRDGLRSHLVRPLRRRHEADPHEQAHHLHLLEFHHQRSNASGFGLFNFSCINLTALDRILSLKSVILRQSNSIWLDKAN